MHRAGPRPAPRPASRAASRAALPAAQGELVRTGRSGTVPGAATAWVRDRLAGPERTGRVLHVGRDATYVEVDGDCLGVLSRAATHVPCGIRTALPSLAGLPGPGRARVGDPVTVGGGRIGFAGTDVVVARLVDAAVPSLVPAPERVAALAAAMTWSVVTDELPAASLAGLRAGDAGAVTDLLGLGGGLTPLGDDVLCGWIATATALGRPDRDAVTASATRLAGARTTLLSATLVGCAARGDVLPQFRRLLLTLADGAGAAPAAALADLVKVGHTSGTGLAAGALLAMDQMPHDPDDLSAHEGNDR